MFSLFLKQPSDWALAEIVMYNRALSVVEFYTLTQDMAARCVNTRCSWQQGAVRFFLMVVI